MQGEKVLFAGVAVACVGGGLPVYEMALAFGGREIRCGAGLDEPLVEGFVSRLALGVRMHELAQVVKGEA